MQCPRCGSEAPDWSERCDNCGLALVETKAGVDRKGPFRLGDVVAERYEIRDRIGVEPLYWAYTALDQEHEQPVMLRVIRRTILPRRQDHKTFARRMEPLTALDLDGVARFLRLDRDGGNTIVVSELVDGLSLRSLIDARRQDGRAFSALETITVLTLVAEALEVAAPVIHHGDLRPLHVLIRDSDLYVEALGVAAALPWEETVRALRASPDSSGYLAPEVMEGSFSDTRSDIYSLAILACEMLTGRLPPVEPGLLEEYLHHLPAITDDILRRALSDDISRRDAAPTELVEALAVVLGVEPLRSTSNEEAITAIGTKVSLHDPTIEIRRDVDGTTPFLEPSSDEQESRDAVPRDPSQPAEAAREGTQKITEDMLEPFHDKASGDEVSRDPAVPATAAAEGTQQITVDMLQPLDEPTAASLEDAEGLVAQLPFEESEVESFRSLGLDPKLVRAARRLDDARDTFDDEAPTLRKKTTPRIGFGDYVIPVPSPPDPEGDGPEELAEEPDEGFEAESANDSGEPGLGEGLGAPLEEDLELTERTPPPPSRGTPPSKEQIDIPADAHGSPWTADLDSLSVDQVTSPASAEMPQALGAGSLGPIQEKVAGGEAISSPVFTDVPYNEELEDDLPAVLIDDALKEAFGESKAASEPTYRVERPKDLEDPTIRSPAAAVKGPSVWRWVLLIALFGGALLAAVGAVGLWVFLGS